MRTLTEPFKIKMVEPLRITTEAYRQAALEKAGYNPFLLRSDDVFIDLLTDSGTGAMSDRQWAGIMMGDESYAGARSWEHLQAVVQELTGMQYVLPTHQGRAAERILYSILGGKGKIFISNTHFDTTRANIEYVGSEAIDIVCKEANDVESYAAFKGNIDLEKLEKLITQYGTGTIAAVIITVTNNSSGGQPVSMQNMKAVRKICDKHGLLMVIDGCRIAENSYYIKHREDGFTEKTYKQIAQEMLNLGDAFIMSAKKDGMVNIGGLLTLKDEALSVKCKNLLIISEGFTTYGGLSGRDMEALAIGLNEVFDKDYLHYRIRSTAYLGEKLREKGVPVVWPIGGHAVYIDAKKLYANVPVVEYPGQALVIDLYLKGGIRCVEVGSVMFGKYNKQGKLVPAINELVRMAIPRRVYTQSHIDYVLDIFDDILEIKNRNKGFKITYEPPFLRHFTAHFEPIK
ncbi:MAG: tryptophanase [Chitinophagaceae bacterium]|nr:tryptophanase [Chitinophagaceae bacterium]MBP6372739.1 tryptophanase [Ferruginibacter sp.]NMD28103.1 tryptophanase [Bacteroidota bacterium]MBK7089286.1 tryptophanase [Chitinophagaceae bacterium]MBK7347543.1 tryptophanase [Chitinophagaceae bacterium]